MENPKRIQRRRGEKFPPNTKSVKHPTKWGNPFKPVFGAKDSPEVKAQKRAVAVQKYTEWLHTTDEGRAIAEAAPRELRGWNLACACPEDGPCHGAILLELANKVF
jgi:hypothetical protein